MKRICGRVWKFGDDINTDLMIPSFALTLPLDKQVEHCFEANRPGWVDQVQPGDLIVGGKNFGAGSSRPGSQVFKRLGISCVLAESINGLFLRNCVNFGLAALSCPGIAEAFEEGEEAEVDLRLGQITNLARGTVVGAAPLPELLIAMIEAGGILAVLEREGYFS